MLGLEDKKSFSKARKATVWPAQMTFQELILGSPSEAARPGVMVTIEFEHNTFLLAIKRAGGEMFCRLALLGFLALASVESAEKKDVSFTAKPKYVDSHLESVTLTCLVTGTGDIYSTEGISIEKDIDLELWSNYAKILKGDTAVRIYQAGVTGSNSLGAPGVSSSLIINITSIGRPDGRFRCVVNGNRPDATPIRLEARLEVPETQNQCHCDDVVAELHNKIASLEESYLRINTLETRLVEAEKKLADASSSGKANDALLGMDGDLMLRSLVWPEGHSALPMPESGCPSQGFSFVDWKTDGYRQFHTESTSAVNVDEFSPGIHLKKPYQNKNGKNNFIFLYFCVNPETKVNAEGPTWPAGSYCISKYATCPPGFQEGNIWFDEENTAHESKYGGTVPTGIYGHDTQLNFCCRRDGEPDTPMYLPTSRPFYLYRFDGKCQKVSGMKVTNEFVVFDTENSAGNNDKYSSEYHPDGKLNDIRLELCYYERAF